MAGSPAKLAMCAGQREHPMVGARGEVHLTHGGAHEVLLSRRSALHCSSGVVQGSIGLYFG